MVSKAKMEHLTCTRQRHHLRFKWSTFLRSFKILVWGPSRNCRTMHTGVMLHSDPLQMNRDYGSVYHGEPSKGTPCASSYGAVEPGLYKRRTPAYSTGGRTKVRKGPQHRCEDQGEGRRPCSTCGRTKGWELLDERGRTGGEGPGEWRGLQDRGVSQVKGWGLQHRRQEQGEGGAR